MTSIGGIRLVYRQDARRPDLPPGMASGLANPVAVKPCTAMVGEALAPWGVRRVPTPIAHITAGS